LDITTLNEHIHAVIWGPVMLVAIMAAGVYFSVGTGFFQFSHFRHWMKKTLFSISKGSEATSSTDKKATSQFQSLATALAGSLGTGNIIGVATAITAGGPGAIFWMWAAALLGMMIKYAENVLGVLYRRRNTKGEWEGGPMLYIEKGLNNKPLAVIFSVLCVLASFGVGNMAQVNAISASMADTLGVPKVVTGLVTAIVVGFVILGGLNRIARVSEKLIPFMSILYCLGGLVIICVHWRGIYPAFQSIFAGAFGLKPMLGGGAGFAISTALRYGVARGVFSNEAGMGSSVIAHSTADVDHPAKQGMWGIFEVFVDTIVICSITALAILSSGVYSAGACDEVLTIAAFEKVFGSWGGIFIAFSVFVFSFASLLGWSFYGWRGLAYITHDRGELLYQVLFLGVTVLGSVINLELAMSISDSFNGLMIIPNMIALLLLSNQVFAQTKDYLKNEKRLPNKLK
jgi:AGCS family alanine or glycine:cation symporter